jgi:hypothetical protein
MPIKLAAPFAMPSGLGFPARKDGLYLHSAPNVRHREHIGRPLLHLTLARKHVSQDALNFGFGEWEEARVDIPTVGAEAGYQIAAIALSEGAVCLEDHQEKLSMRKKHLRLQCSRPKQIQMPKGGQREYKLL